MAQRLPSVVANTQHHSCCRRAAVPAVLTLHIALVEREDIADGRAGPGSTGGTSESGSVPSCCVAECSAVAERSCTAISLYGSHRYSSPLQPGSPMFSAVCDAPGDSCCAQISATDLCAAFRCPEGGHSDTRQLTGWQAAVLCASYRFLDSNDGLRVC